MTNQLRLSNIFIFLLLLLVYVPLIVFGGFGTSDDLSLLVSADPDLKQELLNSLTRIGHSARPLYAISQTLSGFLFQDQPILYALFRLSLWFVCAYLLIRAFRGLINNDSLYFVGIVFGFPIITSSHLFNCFQTGYLLALFFWLLSLYYIEGLYKDFGKRKELISYFFLLLSLLSCEIIFPLFLLNIGLPFIGNKRTRSNFQLGSFVSNSRREIICVLSVCSIFIAHKFLVAPLFQDGYGVYGFSFSWSSFLQFGYYFFCLLVEVPLLLIEVLGSILHFPLAFISLLSFPLCYMLYKQSKDKSLKKKSSDKEIYVLLLVALMGCSFIFLFSGYPAVTYGNYNKMLLPSFVLISLIAGIFLSFLTQRGYWWISGFILFLWVSSMYIQVQNFNESWRIRKTVLQDCVEKVGVTDLGVNPSVVANVPFFLPTNYNNEHVFWLSWDFSNGLKYFGVKKEVDFFPFCYKTLINSAYYPFHNVNFFLDVKSNDNLWVYEYDIKNNISSLKKLNDIEKYWQDQAKRKTNFHEFIVRQFLRERLKNMLL